MVCRDSFMRPKDGKGKWFACKISAQKMSVKRCVFDGLTLGLFQFFPFLVPCQEMVHFGTVYLYILIEFRHLSIYFFIHIIYAVPRRPPEPKMPPSHAQVGAQIVDLKA